MDDQPRRIQSCVRKILNELSAEALLLLKDSRLEVMLRPEGDFSVWAYFPVHQRRLIAKALRPKPQTRVLLFEPTKAAFELVGFSPIKAVLDPSKACGDGHAR